MNSCIWILLLLGCCGNNCNNWSTWDNNCCDNGMNHCGCNNDWRNNGCGCSNNWNDNDCGCGGNLIQPRVTNECGCENHHHHHNHNRNNDCDGDNRFGQNNNYMTPPPVPGRVCNDDCGCDD